MIDEQYSQHHRRAIGRKLGTIDGTDHPQALS